MPLLRLPKTILWLGICALIFLILMTLYRIGIHAYFNYGNVTGSELARAFWIGLRFDCRILGGLTLFLFLLSLLPGLHFFKKSTGKNTTLILYAVFTALLFVFYAADLMHLFIFKTRLSNTLFSDLAQDSEKTIAYKHNVPWVVLFMIIAAMVWIFFIGFKFIHKKMSKITSPDQKTVRIYWQTVTVLLCIVALHGRLGRESLNLSIAQKMMEPAAAQLSLNPVQSFFSATKVKAIEDANP